MTTPETSDMLSTVGCREQLLEIARLAHMLAYTPPHKIPLTELRKILRIEEALVKDLTQAEEKEKPLPLMSRLAMQEIRRRFAVSI